MKGCFSRNSALTGILYFLMELLQVQAVEVSRKMPFLFGHNGINLLEVLLVEKFS